MGRPAQIAIVRLGGIGEFLSGGDAVLFQHCHQQLGFYHLPGEEKYHTVTVARTDANFTANFSE